MNAQQQSKAQSLWDSVLKAMVLALVNQFGKTALEWLRNKIDELIESGEADDAEANGVPVCPPGYYWDETTKSCKKDIGVS